MAQRLPSQRGQEAKGSVCNEHRVLRASHPRTVQLQRWQAGAKMSKRHKMATRSPAASPPPALPIPVAGGLRPAANPARFKEQFGGLDHCCILPECRGSAAGPGEGEGGS